MISRVCIVGSGNVAWHLSKTLLSSGIAVTQVVSRNTSSGEQLAKDLGARFSYSLEDVSQADLVILAVPDDAIRELSEKINGDCFVVHTSGSVPMDGLRQDRRGVFYPLQTFSKSKSINFLEVPICIEAQHPKDLELLGNLGRKLSNNVQQITSQQRYNLHIAAVFVSNFVNQLYREAEAILHASDMPFDLLKPLIKEVASKIEHLSPREAMTGPAKRGDDKTISRHMAHLNSDPDLRDLYQLLSKRIQSDTSSTT